MNKRGVWATVTIAAAHRRCGFTPHRRGRRHRSWRATRRTAFLMSAVCRSVVIDGAPVFLTYRRGVGLGLLRSVAPLARCAQPVPRPHGAIPPRWHGVCEDTHRPRLTSRPGRTALWARRAGALRARSAQCPQAAAPWHRGGFADPAVFRAAASSPLEAASCVRARGSDPRAPASGALAASHPWAAASARAAVVSPLPEVDSVRLPEVDSIRPPAVIIPETACSHSSEPTE